MIHNETIEKTNVFFLHIPNKINGNVRGYTKPMMEFENIMFILKTVCHVNPKVFSNKIRTYMSRYIVIL